MSSFVYTNGSFQRQLSPSKHNTKTLDSTHHGTGTYHILRLCADDPENDTTVKELIDRTERHLSIADGPQSDSESLVAEYYIERTSQRICNVLRRLELSEGGSLANTGSKDIFRRPSRVRDAPSKKRKRQPDSLLQAFNEQARLP